MGIHGLSLSIRQIVQVVLALTCAAGPYKRPFVNPTLSFLLSFCYCFGSLVFPRSRAMLKNLLHWYWSSAEGPLQNNEGAPEYYLIYVYVYVEPYRHVF